MTSTGTVTVYSKTPCVQCTATYRALDNAGVLYDVIELETMSVEQIDAFKARGLTQAPVVITDTDAWAGFRPDRIAALQERRPA